MSEEGVLLLQRLHRERLELDELSAGIAAVKVRFLPTDLRGVDFSHKDLSHHFLLSDVDLSYAMFEGATIRGSFQSSKLVGACFDSADIVHGYFCESDLESTSFRGARVRAAEFAGANLLRTSFRGAVLEDVSFQNVDLTSVDLSGVRLGRVKWAGAKLRRSHDALDLVARASESVNVDKLIWV